MSPKGHDRKKKRPNVKVEIPKLDLQKVYDMPVSPEVNLAPEHQRAGSEKDEEVFEKNSNSLELLEFEQNNSKYKEEINEKLDINISDFGLLSDNNSDDGIIDAALDDDVIDFLASCKEQQEGEKRAKSVLMTSNLFYSKNKLEKTPFEYEKLSEVIDEIEDENL